MRNVLIVGAHFDDCELGCGGTAAKLIAQGCNVYKITLTDTRVISEKMNLDITTESCLNNSNESCKIIGLKCINFPFSPYGELKYSKTLMQKLERIIIDYEIDTCFFHFSDDYNTDHVAAHQICKTAARHCKNLLMYQSNPYIVSEPYYPNFFVDISDYVEVKRRALNCYDKDHNRQGNLFETNLERNKIWGYGIHVKYAEGFMCIKYSYEK